MTSKSMWRRGFSLALYGLAAPALGSAHRDEGFLGHLLRQFDIELVFESMKLNEQNGV